MVDGGGEEQEKRELGRREKELGYRPQKEIVYNRLLPYADRLDEESARLLAQIRTNLAKAVLFKELKPGCALWTARLIKYLKLYGLKFSKECHIELINLIYELIIVPDLEPTKLHKFCTVLILLTKRTYLLSPEELTLQWRPLYEVGRRIFSKSTATLGMYHYHSQKRDKDDDSDDEANDDDDSALLLSQLLEKFKIEMPIQLPEATSDNESLESTFGTMILYVKVYFPPNATQEILDEFLPRFLPPQSKSQEVIQDLVLYLPYLVLPAHRDRGYKLWLDDFMLLWKVCHNAPHWESDMMSLVSSVASNNIGQIDWEPHIPWMFAKFLQSFNLPVFYKQTQNNRQHNIDVTGISKWIVAVLGSNSSAQSYLANFMTTIATYIHGSNAGKWSGKLRDLLRKLPIAFVDRVHKERSDYKTSWEPKTPEANKLTDEDIDKFVKCLLDVCLQTMFSRSGFADVCMSLQYLALLRPSLVIPPVIEKMWNTFDSLTEPHKFTCAMQCVIAVARPLASGFENGYPEGPTHIIPLLLSCLPGLDPNDFKKTLVTFNFISIFTNLIPLVDCTGASDYWNNLSEEEQTVCESTGQIEDFVLQYFDRIFVLIESSSFEQTRLEQKDIKSLKSKLESTAEGAVTSASISILGQTSTPLFKLALRKFFNFATQRVLETNVAGHTAASLCRAFSRVNAEETFKLFIPHLCDVINNIIADNEDVIKEESLDKELLYNLLLLSQVVEKNGIHLLPYMPKIFSVLDKTLNIASEEGYIFVCSMLKNLIMSLSSVYPKKCRSSPLDYDASLENFLPIREWGKAGNVWKCDLEWHLPTSEEITCVQTILHRYLIPQLDLLNCYIKDEATLSREKLNKTLSIVRALLSANSLMPPSDKETVKLVDSDIIWESFDITTGIDQTISMPDGSNIRKTVQKTMHELQTKLLNSNEDDTRSLCKLISIWELLVTRNCFSSTLFETHLKMFTVVKKSLENKLLGRVGHLRILLSERTLLQHEFRIQSISGPLNISQAEVMIDLLTLATSRYSEVRSFAQCRLNWMVSNFAYSFEVILPHLVKCLGADAETEHERLKGALYCVLGPKQTPIIAKHDWKVIGAIWPALIHSSPSEKPSVIRLMDSILRSIILNFPTITIKLKWSDSCIEKAMKLLTDSEKQDPTILELIKKSDDNVMKVDQENIAEYNKLLNVLIDGAESTQLHWRHSLMCLSMLPALVHLDIPYPPKAIKLILNSLIHDSILVRKQAVKLMVFVMKQRKRSHKNIDVNSSELSGITSEEINKKLIPGFRPDNMWMQYDETKPLDKNTWDKSPYCHKDNFGFYYWPKTIRMYAPLVEQPEYIFSETDQNEADTEIYGFFSSKENVDKYITFFSMEDKKGKDKFSLHRFMMYKGLFSNYMDSFLPLFIDHLKKLVSTKQEALQRCGAEIIAGIIRSTKHWPYDKMENLKIVLTPILKSVFENMMIETIGDWGACFAVCFESMNVSRLGWLLQLLEDGIGKDISSYQLCGQLCFLQAVVFQHSWRLASYSDRLLQRLNDKGMFSHPYQNVRNRIASILSNLFDQDIVYPGGTQNVAPSITKFVEGVTPLMETLFKEGLLNANNINNHSVLPALSFPVEDDSFSLNNSKNDTNNHKSNSLTSDKLKLIIQDSINKSGIEKNNINISAVSKLIREVKKSNNPNDNDMDLEDESNSPLETFILNASFLGNNHNRKDNLPFMELLEEKLSLALKIGEDMAIEKGKKEDSQNDINMRTFKTILKWMTTAIYIGPYGTRSPFYVAVPAACVLGTRDGDEELYRLCAAFLSMLAESLHDFDSLKVAIATVEKVCQSSSWCARVSSLSFLQSLVFHNMAFIIKSPFVANVRSITLQLMNDSSPEVREVAAVMLAGLVHCGVLTDTRALLDHFKDLCNGGRLEKGPNRAEALARRHCGILGLCAFVAAQPYTIPTYLSEIFSILGRHLNDPLPIPPTIHKTLRDFKRTHHSEWETHQLKFTEEELSLLNELSVPPSYYA